MIEYGIVELPWWAAILAGVVAVIGAARLTRLLTTDDLPPVVAIRMWWSRIHNLDGPWAKLVHCLWCAGPWFFLAALVSFIVSFLHPGLGWAWWIFWGWMAGSYLVSQYVFFDEGRSDE